MSSAGEHKMGNFSFDFLCKNNFILFPPRNESLENNKRNEILSWDDVLKVWIEHVPCRGA